MSSWRKHKLSQVATIISGGTPKSGVSEYWGNDIRWITPKDMGQLTSKYVSDTGRRISKLGLDKSSAKLIASNSVILSTRAPIGHLAINTEAMSTNQGCRGLTPTSDLHTKYLYYFLLGSVDLLNELGTGTTFKELSKTALEGVEIPLPLIPEQQRIVAILDQAFADIDKARANAEKNLKNARGLFDSYLNQVFSQRGEGWVKEPLKNIAKITMGQSPKGSSYNTSGQGTPLINGPVEFGPSAFSKTLKTKFTTSPTKMCKAGDLILCVRGSTTGRMNIAGFDACIGRGVAAISSSEYQDWLNQYIDFKRENIYKLGTGATFPNISSSILGDFIVVIPPLKDMDDVLNLIFSLRQSCEALNEKYLHKLKSLDELKKSLLQKAFSGELTKTEGHAA